MFKLNGSMCPLCRKNMRVVTPCDYCDSDITSKNDVTTLIRLTYGHKYHPFCILLVGNGCNKCERFEIQAWQTPINSYKFPLTPTYFISQLIVLISMKLVVSYMVIIDRKIICSNLFQSSLQWYRLNILWWVWVVPIFVVKMSY